MVGSAGSRSDGFSPGTTLSMGPHRRMCVAASAKSVESTNASGWPGAAEARSKGCVI
jgi:hypothetical protein